MEEYTNLAVEELVRACVEGGQPDAWEEFVRRFHPVISSVVVRVSWRWGETSRSALDDLVQEIHLKFCENHCELLRKFEPRHPDSIFGYIKVISANVVHDHFKSKHTLKRGVESVCQNAEVSDLAAQSCAAGGPAAIERDILIGEIESALERIAGSPEQRRSRTIFWLYYRQGLTAEAIGSLPSIQMNTKGVESAILRLTRLVREELTSRSPGRQKTDRGEGFHAVESL